MSPSDKLVAACRRQLENSLRAQRRSSESHRNQCDMLQYALSNEDVDILGAIGDDLEGLPIWWLSLCEHIGLKHKPVTDLGFRNSWIKSKLANRVTASGNSEAVPPGVVGSPPRPEQRIFRDSLMHAYDARCAVTQEAEGLEAAHIIMESIGHDSSVGNGLLLARTLHQAFDRCHWTLTTDYVIKVNPAKVGLLPYHDTRIILPKDHTLYPRMECLQWHNYRCRRWFPGQVR